MSVYGGIVMRKGDIKKYKENFMVIQYSPASSSTSAESIPTSS